MTAIPRRRITLIRARHGLAQQDYDAHWSGPHAAIARDLPGLVWYVQNHVVKRLTPTRSRFGDLDGIAEIAFEDPGKLRGTVTGWSRVGELRNDEQAFLSDKFTFVTRVPPSPPDLRQRRIVAMLERPADGSPAPGEDALQGAAAAISAVCPAHVQMVATDPGTPADDAQMQPHALIFVEVPDAAGADLVAPGGPILGRIAAIGLPASVYLMAAEAKRLPADLAG
jgi:hypothetical protein